MLIAKIMNEAGLPKGVLNVITHSRQDAPKIAEALIAHPAVRRINFTGSTRVGRLIAEMAARHLKPVLLELGGKAPLVVLDDADVDAAVDATVFGAFANAGQICMSTERVIVDETVADELPRSLRSGWPRCRPVIRTRARSSSVRRRQADRGARATAGRRRRRGAPECSLAVRATAPS
jgi:acyl-CoA reductase-like NAD-dependent aldehyde dehydrogenase